MRSEKDTANWYQAALADEALPEEVKEDLKEAFTAYKELKLIAETLSTGNTKSGLSLDEFRDKVVQLWRDVHFHATSVGKVTAQALAN
jgi:hypothetical protein